MEIWQWMYFALVLVAIIVWTRWLVHRMRADAEATEREIAHLEIHLRNDMIEEPCRCECRDPSCGLDTDQLRGEILCTRQVPTDDSFLNPSATKALSKRTLH